MQQAIEDCGRDYRVAENRTPFAVDLVRSQDDAAPFVSCADQSEEDCRAEFIERQISHLVYDEHLGREIDSQPPVETSLPIRPPQIRYQIVSGHKVGRSVTPTCDTKFMLYQRGGQYT